jgi:hypothetical protein
MGTAAATHTPNAAATATREPGPAGLTATPEGVPIIARHKVPMTVGMEEETERERDPMRVRDAEPRADHEMRWVVDVRDPLHDVGGPGAVELFLLLSARAGPRCREGLGPCRSGRIVLHELSVELRRELGKRNAKRTVRVAARSNVDREHPLRWVHALDREPAPVASVDALAGLRH